jgi:phage terminase large subunit-like protein
VRGSTFDNAANLAPSALIQLRERYEGTRLGRQELFAELLLDNPASLWRYDDILIAQPPEMKRVIIAVDPAVTNTEDSDETGIIICGKGVDNTLWVLGDYSCKDTTFGWAKRVAALYEEFGASLIVYEKNQGGNTQEEIIHSLDPYLPVKPISAKQGKKLRAEPVAMLYEQHKVFHSKHFEKLEDQYTSWDPETPGDSPDRLDAAVHGLTELADIGAGSRFLLDLASICGNCQQPNSKDATMCFSCKQPMNG